MHFTCDIRPDYTLETMCCPRFSCSKLMCTPWKLTDSRVDGFFLTVGLVLISGFLWLIPITISMCCSINRNTPLTSKHNRHHYEPLNSISYSEPPPPSIPSRAHLRRSRTNRSMEEIDLRRREREKINSRDCNKIFDHIHGNNHTEDNPYHYHSNGHDYFLSGHMIREQSTRENREGVLEEVSIDYRMLTVNCENQVATLKLKQETHPCVTLFFLFLPFLLLLDGCFNKIRAVRLNGQDSNLSELRKNRLFSNVFKNMAAVL